MSIQATVNKEESTDHAKKLCTIIDTNMSRQYQWQTHLGAKNLPSPAEMGIVIADQLRLSTVAGIPQPDTSMYHAQCVDSTVWTSSRNNNR